MYVAFLTVFIASASASSVAPEYRTYDGTNNNQQDITKGSTGTVLSRQGMSPFTDYITGQIPRALSNALNAGPQTGEYDARAGIPIPIAYTRPSSVKANMFRELFAQFVSHDQQRMSTGVGIGFTAPHLEPLSPVDILYLRPCDFAAGETLPSCYNASDFNMYPLGPGLGPNFMTFTGVKTINGDVVNDVTSWLDLSTVYGSDPATVIKLRTNYDDPARTLVGGGKLYSTNHSWVFYYAPFTPLPGFPPTGPFFDLPPSLQTIGATGDFGGFANPDGLFAQEDVLVAGDERANNNMLLTATHVVWFRHHNVLATELKAQNPTWSSDVLFEEARRRNIAIYQKIVFDDYLVAVLGEKAKEKQYIQYNSSVDAPTSLNFDIAFRYGHSTIAQFDTINSKGCSTPVYGLDGTPGQSDIAGAGQQGGPFGFTALLSAITNPATRDYANAITTIIRSAITGISDDSDLSVYESIRSIPFVLGSGIPVIAGRGVDLAAIDLLRSVQSSAPSYLQLREKYWDGRTSDKQIYGTPLCPASVSTSSPDPIECFDIITANRDVSTKLRAIYGKVSLINSFAGLMSEPTLEEKNKNKRPSSVGGTLQGIILQEYLNKRDGDRFWYENGQFNAAELAVIKATTYRDVLSKVGVNVTGFPADVFTIPPPNAPLSSCVA